MSVTTYEAKFRALFRYATQLCFSPQERIRSFVKGLRSDLQIPALQVATAPKSFQEVVDFVIVEKVYRSCLVNFVGRNTHVDLIILEMVDFDVILGMTWLSPNFAILDCNAKTVTLAKPGTDPLRG